MSSYLCAGLPLDVTQKKDLSLIRKGLIFLLNDSPSHLLLQDCVLFHDTIEYNLHYGNLGVGRADVERVAKMAELHDSILSWPKGYQTQVLPKGILGTVVPMTAVVGIFCSQRLCKTDPHIFFL